MKIIRRRSNIVLIAEEIPFYIKELLTIRNNFGSAGFEIGINTNLYTEKFDDAIRCEFFKKHHDSKLGTYFILPKYILPELLNLNIEEFDLVENDSHWPVREIDLQMNGAPKNKLQKDAVGFLSNYSTDCNHHLGAQTGKGKTFIALYMAYLRKNPFVVIVHNKTFLERWIAEEITVHLNITREEVGVISGKTSIKKLLKCPTKYKCFVMIHRTGSNVFSSETDRSMLIKLFRDAGVGTKMFDEVHLENAAIFNIDAYTQIKHTIYMSATVFHRSFKKDNILSYIIPRESSSFGLEVENRTKAHQELLFCIMNSYPSKNAISSVCRDNTTRLDMYDDYILNHRFEKYMAIIDTYYHRVRKASSNERKIAIVCGTLKLCSAIKDYMINNPTYVGETIVEFNTNVENVIERKENLKNGSIIITTDQSFKEGENSFTELIISLVPMNYGVSFVQSFGRLRKFREADIAYYVYVADIGFSNIENMAIDCANKLKANPMEYNRILCDLYDVKRVDLRAKLSSLG